MFPPFDSSTGIAAKTKLSIIHFHDRCPEQLFEINRKVCRSHGFVSDMESDQQALDRFKKVLERPHLCGLSGEDIKKVTGSEVSSHKVIGYLDYLDGCPHPIEKIDPTLTSGNPDFFHYLNAAASLM